VLQAGFDGAQLRELTLGYGDRLQKFSGTGFAVAHAVKAGQGLK